MYAFFITNKTQVEKFKKCDFGKCPRVLCDSQPLLPMGLSDVPGVKSVKLYCARCEDIYNPKSSRHAAIDGAYFGSSFHNILFQVYPALVPPKSRRRYEPRIFGFKVHAAAALARWQDGARSEMRERLREAGVPEAQVDRRDIVMNNGSGATGGSANAPVGLFVEDAHSDDDVVGLVMQQSQTQTHGPRRGGSEHAANTAAASGAGSLE